MHTVITALPQLRPHAPCVLIGGTNGKGTTAGFAFSLLAHTAHLKIGLYTSPHVSHFCERIQVSHRQLDDTALHHTWHELQPLLAPFRQQLTFFECTTLLAFYTFNRSATDINILEVGLGGTWDATNICDPIAAAIVAIGIDHQQYLGTTYAAILTDKMGITRPHRPLFWGQQGSGANDPHTQHTLHKISQQKQLTLFRADKNFSCNDNNIINLNLPPLPPINTPLPPSLTEQPYWLQRNFTLAFALTHWLLHYLNLPYTQLADTIHNLPHLLPSTIPARCQYRQLRHCHTGQIQSLLLDACHNYDGALALTAELHRRNINTAGMLSLLSDKEIDKIVPLLAQYLNPLAIFALNHHRGMARTQLSSAWQHCWHDNCTAAWQSIIKKPTSTPIVICGSFYGLGEMLEFLSHHPEWNLV